MPSRGEVWVNDEQRRCLAAASSVTGSLSAWSPHLSVLSAAHGRETEPSTSYYNTQTLPIVQAQRSYSELLQSLPMYQPYASCFFSDLHQCSLVSAGMIFLAMLYMG